MVGARGFEPPASWSRTRRSTRLSHAPNFTSVARAATRDIIELMATSTKSLYDIDFVECEGLGKSERSAVRSQLHRMLVHLSSDWASLRNDPGSSSARWPQLQRIYREPVELALVETNLAGPGANPDIPKECPCTLESLLDGDLNALWPR
jgi:hypothetical protein